jgi:hypothetical protein
MRQRTGPLRCEDWASALTGGAASTDLKMDRPTSLDGLASHPCSSQHHPALPLAIAGRGYPWAPLLHCAEASRQPQVAHRRFQHLLLHRRGAGEASRRLSESLGVVEESGATAPRAAGVSARRQCVAQQNAQRALAVERHFDSHGTPWTWTQTVAHWVEHWGSGRAGGVRSGAAGCCAAGDGKGRHL